MAGLKQHPGGHGALRRLRLPGEICNGNTRVRASNDRRRLGRRPGCYLSDEEIGAMNLNWKILVPAGFAA